jgi:FtsH-binding integral membrane protein
LHGVWWFIVPGAGVAQQRRARAAGAHGLIVLRQTYLAFALALALIAVVVVPMSAATTLTPHPYRPAPVSVAVLVLGVVALFGVRLVEKPLDCSDDRRLAGSYRIRFFARLAFSESASLLGFAAFIITNSAWPFFLGAACTAVGYYRLAPTKAHLDQDQDVLDHAGCTRSLRAAMAVLPPPRGSK